jgi:ABC-type branched-subunit amino acid transport system ATPase component/branched-subunit amino acid ABC-type transport system permease component
MPWGLAVIVSGLIAVPVGAVLAIPAIRLSGLYLALATFGFGLLLSFMFYSQKFMFGSLGVGLTAPRPSGFETDTSYYYLMLVLAVLASLLVVGINHARIGRLLRALADSPVALATGGTSTVVAQVVVFCIAAFLAAVSGALGGSADQVISADSYQPLMSLTYLTLVMIMAGRAPWYAVASGLAMTVIPSYITSPDAPHWLGLLFGLGAVGLAFQGQTNEHITQRIAAAIDPILRSKGESAASRRSASAEPVYEVANVVPTVLALDDLRVRFGGLVAVDGVSLEAPTGKITGLIGPNGAGKTTTFNSCSGLNRPSAGAVKFGGSSITRRSPAWRARNGIGRTFQQMELFDSLTVEQNVRLGLESKLAGASVLTQLVARSSERTRVAGSARAAIELCGITGLAGRRTADLSTGQRRLVELARAIAGEHSILLLDEPSSGLDKEETAAFGSILTKVVQERGVGILIVEHDMSLVMSTCDHVYVLDFGSLIFEGKTTDVQRSDVVRAAYLGSSADETLREVEEALEREALR